MSCDKGHCDNSEEGGGASPSKEIVTGHYRHGDISKVFWVGGDEEDMHVNVLQVRDSD